MIQVIPQASRAFSWIFALRFSRVAIYMILELTNKSKIPSNFQLRRMSHKAPFQVFKVPTNPVSQR